MRINDIVSTVALEFVNYHFINFKMMNKNKMIGVDFNLHSN